MRLLIVSGPTREKLDPVRYLSNYSTGTMGRYLVSAAKERGHHVEWVECPQRAESARDLDRLLPGLLKAADALIMAAAVADVRPAAYSSAKIKKDRLRSIRLVKNPDVLANLARKKTSRQVFIGFGLESKDLLANGAEKIRRKGLELIVLQKVTDGSTPFGEKAIDAVLMDAKGNTKAFASVSKKRLAGIIVRRAEEVFDSKNRD